MTIKPFTVDGNIVVNEATLSNSTTSLVLPAGSTITGGGTVLDTTNSDTDDLTEGVTNLYFTDARADARIALQAGDNLDLSGKTTTDLSEGTNLYYTDARADARIALQAGANLDLSGKTTTDLAEGTNLYYTDARADARIAAASITDLSDADQSVQTTDNVTFANITTTGYIAGPATFTIDPAAVGDATGTVVILGDLQVDGTTTTINSTTLDVDDLNITVASGAANAAAADGAGLTVDGASATLTYDSANDRWAMNKSLDVTGTITADGLTVDGTAVEVVSINSTQNGAQINFDSASTTNDWSIGISNSADGDFLIYQNAAAGAGDLRLYTNGQERLTIFSGGNVGIDTDTLYVDATNNRVGVGTTTPATALDVTGTVTADGLNVSGTNDVALIITNQSNYTEGLTIRNTANWGYGSSVSFESKTSDGGSNAEVGRIQSTWNAAGYHGLDFYALNNNTLLRHMRLDGSGDFSLYDDTGVNASFFWDASEERLGIGTTSANYPLDVRKNSTTDYVSSSTSSAVPYVNGDSVISLSNNTATTNRAAYLAMGSTDAWGVTNVKYLGVVSETGTYGGNFIIGGRTGSSSYSEHFRIDASGKVGIGTTSPDDKLHVYSTSSLDHIKVDGPAAINRNVQFSTAGTARWNIYTNSTAESGSDAGSDLSIARYTDAGAYNGVVMLMDRATGNVGIGTATPQTNLHVNGSWVANYGTLSIDGPLNGLAGIGIRGNSAYQGSLIWRDGTAGNHLELTSFNSNPLYLKTNNTERIAITGAGNVGIGTTSPNTATNYRSLHIDGSVGSLIDIGASGLESRIVADTNGLGFQVTPGSHTYQNIRWKAGQISGATDSHMLLNSSGNVGIGTDSPAGKLEVENTSVNYAILGTSNKGHYFESQSDDNTDGFEIYQQHGSNTTRNSFIVNDNRTGSKSAALVVRGDGNVGIGVASPSYTLDVDVGAPSATDKTIARFSSQVGIRDIGFVWDDSASTLGIATLTNHKMVFHTNGNSNPRMTIDTSGFVGIGTTNPDYQLDQYSSYPAGQTKIMRRRYDEVVVQYNQGTSGSGTTTVVVTLSVTGLRGVVLTADFSGSRNNSGPDNYMTRICHALMSEGTNLRRSDRLTGLEFAVGATPVTVTSVAMSSDKIQVTYSIAPNSNAYDVRALFTAKGPGIIDLTVSSSFA